MHDVQVCVRVIAVVHVCTCKVCKAEQIHDVQVCVQVCVYVRACVCVCVCEL
jgi:hypothetical protein